MLALPLDDLAVEGSISPAAGSTRPSIARARVDLPQPDSPTTPRISPGRHSSETPSTARATPLRALNCDRQVADLHQRVSLMTRAFRGRRGTRGGHSLQGAKWQAPRGPADLAQRRVDEAASAA